MAQYIISLDQGTTSSCRIVFRAAGNIVSSARTELAVPAEAKAGRT